MKRNTILNVSVAVAVFFTAAIGAMSFKKSGNKAAKVATIYYYNNTDTSPGAFSNVANWSTGGSNVCESRGSRPCQAIVEEGQTLNDVIGGLTNAQVLAMHPNERKP